MRPGSTFRAVFAALTAGALVLSSLLLALPAQGARHKTKDRFCGAHGALSAAALPSRVSADRCDLVGRRVTNGSLSLRVPRPGRGVGAAAIGTGAEDTLTIMTMADGTVTIEGSMSIEGPTVFGTEEPAPCDDKYLDGCMDPCLDTNYNLYGNNPKVKKKQPWFFKITTTPALLTQADALAQIRAGTSNIVRVNNDCGQGDFIEQTAPYKGTTTVSTGITVSQRPGQYPVQKCPARGDGKNVVDFGKLVSTGYACYRMITWDYEHWFMTEGDIRLNKDTAWTITPDDPECFDEVNLQGVMTHERGHLWGLDHTDYDDMQHAPQTMFPVVYPCSSYNNTLGKGDMRGLNRLY